MLDRVKFFGWQTDAATGIQTHNYHHDAVKFRKEKNDLWWVLRIKNKSTPKKRAVFNSGHIESPIHLISLGVDVTGLLEFIPAVLGSKPGWHPLVCGLLQGHKARRATIHTDTLTRGLFSQMWTSSCCGSEYAAGSTWRKPRQTPGEPANSTWDDSVEEPSPRYSLGEVFACLASFSM